MCSYIYELVTDDKYMKCMTYKIYIYRPKNCCFVVVTIVFYIYNWSHDDMLKMCIKGITKFI